MCGRYALHAHPDVIALQFALSTPPEFEPKFNNAPSSDVLIVREDKERMLLHRQGRQRASALLVNHVRPL